MPLSRSLRLAAPSALFLAFSMLTPASSAADPTLLSLAAPGSNFAIGIDVQALAASPLGQEAMLKAQTENPSWGDAMAMLGPNPLARIHEVLIVGDVEAAREQQKGLVLIKGDFADDSWVSAVCQNGCPTESYQGFTLRGAPNADNPGVFTQLDPSYIALGSPEHVRGLIDRRVSGSGSSFGSAVRGWTSRASGHHLWIAAKGPFDMPHAGADPMGVRNFANLDAFGLGMTLGSNLEVGMELRSFSDAESIQLHQALQGLLLMASAGAQQDPDAAELLRGLNISQAAQTVTASLHVPGYLLRRMAEKRAGAAMAGSGIAPAQPAPRPRRPRQGVIRIDGLDGGPVEVESAPVQ